MGSETTTYVESHEGTRRYANRTSDVKFPVGYFIFYLAFLYLLTVFPVDSSVKAFDRIKRNWPLAARRDTLLCDNRCLAWQTGTAFVNLFISASISTISTTRTVLLFGQPANPGYIGPLRTAHIKCRTTQESPKTALMTWTKKLCFSGRETWSFSYWHSLCCEKYLFVVYCFE